MGHQRLLREGRGTVVGVGTKDIVARDPGVLNDDLRFAGTRVPVKNLVDHLAAGGTLDDFLEGFPGVSRAQAVAYLQMAREAAEDRVPAGRAS
jgi:uncharacterized protein (DUF433 family)